MFNMIKVTKPYSYNYYYKPDWHDNQEDAIIQAEKMLLFKPRR